MLTRELKGLESDLGSVTSSYHLTSETQFPHLKSETKTKISQDSKLIWCICYC